MYKTEQLGILFHSPGRNASTVFVPFLFFRHTVHGVLTHSQRHDDQNVGDTESEILIGMKLHPHLYPPFIVGASIHFLHDMCAEPTDFQLQEPCVLHVASLQL